MLGPVCMIIPYFLHFFCACFLSFLWLKLKPIHLLNISLVRSLRLHILLTYICGVMVIQQTALTVCH